MEELLLLATPTSPPPQLHNTTHRMREEWREGWRRERENGTPDAASK
jgi:hypothetical protein